MNQQNFDWQYYIEKYPDLKKSGINNKLKATKHYFKNGIKEKRFPNLNSENSENLNSYKKNIDNKTNIFNIIDNELNNDNISFDEISFDKNIFNILKKENKDMKNNIKDIKNNIKDIKNNINLILTLLQEKIPNNHSNILISENNPSTIESENIKINNEKIESSEEYYLQNNNSEENNNNMDSDNIENSSESDNFKNIQNIIKYSNSNSNSNSDEYNITYESD